MAEHIKSVTKREMLVGKCDIKNGFHDIDRKLSAVSLGGLVATPQIKPKEKNEHPPTQPVEEEEEEVNFEADEMDKGLTEKRHDTINIMGPFSRLHTKYDFVKVKVWLEDHYYVLSRFIVSRVLTLTKVNRSSAMMTPTLLL